MPRLGRMPRSASTSEPLGVRSSSTMMVIRMAMTPSLKASSRVLLIAGGLGRHGSHTVQGGAVVPQDVALGLVRDRQLQEGVHGVRVARVRMLEVGREDDVLGAERVHGVFDGRLVAFDGHV